MQHVPEEVRQLQQVQQQDVADGDLSPEGDTAGGAARRSMRGDAKAVRQAEASATTSSDGADKPSGPAPRRINRRLRTEVVDEMVQLHRSGCMVKEIAQQFGFHHETVATHLKRVGLTLRARPVFHHQREAIEAHLTVVMASLAVAHYLQDTTGISIKRIIGTLKPLQDVTINLNDHHLTAAPRLTDTANDILTALNAPLPAH